MQVLNELKILEGLNRLCATTTTAAAAATAAATTKRRLQSPFFHWSLRVSLNVGDLT